MKHEVVEDQGVVVFTPYERLKNIVTMLNETIVQYHETASERNDMVRLLDYVSLRWQGSKTRIIGDKDTWDQYFEMKFGDKDVRINIQDMTIQEAVKAIEEKVDEF